MREPTRLRGSRAVRFGWLIAGLLVFAAGIVALFQSGLGLSPWDVLHEGIAERTRLSFGAANIVVGAFVLLAAWLLGARVGVGTLANAVLVGVFVDVLNSLAWVDALGDGPLGARIALLVVGLALMGVGSGFYIGANLGAGPRDSLMVVGARRTPLRIGLVRGLIEVSALAAGFALGGTVGVGTLASALGIGPAVELTFALLARSPLAAPGGAPTPAPEPAT